jgi:type II secretory pathway pseudopilin PulG
MTLLWIIIIVLAIIGVLALLGRGRFWGARR